MMESVNLTLLKIGLFRVCFEPICVCYSEDQSFTTFSQYPQHQGCSHPAIPPVEKQLLLVTFCNMTIYFRLAPRCC